MSLLRQQLLSAVTSHFGRWVADASLPFACQKGCATCCTQNVTMTAVEGDLIHAFINEKGQQRWFAEKLRAPKHRQPVVETMNEFAARCLAGKEAQEQDLEETEAVCPFLEEECCRIYEVRPFACRCFASMERCLAGQAAALPSFYISASTAAQQIIEHVGQGEYWGNMHDVLLALCDLKENEETSALLPSPSMADQARARLKKAQPLPGFLINSEEYQRVSPFMGALFNEKIGARTVEDILNGK